MNKDRKELEEKTDYYTKKALTLIFLYSESLSSLPGNVKSSVTIPAESLHWRIWLLQLALHNKLTLQSLTVKLEDIHHGEIGGAQRQENWDNAREQG